MAAAFLVVLLGLGVAFLAEGLGVAFLALAGFLVADFFTCRRRHGSRTRAQGTAAGAGVSVHVHKCRWVASYSGTGAKASKLQRRQASLSGAHDIAGGACCCPYQNSSARQQAHSTTMQSTRH